MSDTAALDPMALERRAVRGTSSAVMAMVLFVASEAVFFGAFFGVYANAYADTAVWPPLPAPLPDLVLPSIAVAVLLASGVTMALAVRGTRHGGLRGTVAWLLATVAGAAGFIGLVVASLPGIGFAAGDGIYQSLVYTITVLALAHVVGGLVLLALVFARVRTAGPALAREPATAAAIYWSFVVALGVVMYVVLDVAAAAA
jgi:heme/copper-type cytochrome/quinol oxidase subunit 3